MRFVNLVKEDTIYILINEEVRKVEENKNDVKLSYMENLYLTGLLLREIKREDLKKDEPAYDFVNKIINKLPCLTE